MKYKITAPTEKYDRKIGGIQFVNGAAETDNSWLASWFSGRPGFTAEVIPEAPTEDKKAPPEDKKAPPRKPKEGKNPDDERKTAGDGENSDPDGAGTGA